MLLRHQDCDNPLMGSRLAYRQFHDQTNVAAVTSVLMAEFGLGELDTSRPRQELTLHGLLQRGVYQEGSGMLLRRALRHIGVSGLKWTLVHDRARTAALETVVRRADP